MLLCHAVFSLHLLCSPCTWWFKTFESKDEILQCYIESVVEVVMCDHYFILESSEKTRLFISIATC